MGRAVFPGSFDPFSIAHLAIADAAFDQLDVDTVVCSLSRSPLGKDPAAQTGVDLRASAIADFTRGRPWLRVVVTDERLLVDVARGFEWLIVGADKWVQMHDPVFYGDAAAMDDALARLPRVAYVPRMGDDEVPDAVTVLDLDPTLRPVSSSAIRAGRDEWRAT